MEGQSVLWSLALIVATFFGPIAAVQAQKWLDRNRARHDRKEWVFYMLMTNRRARLHPDFVRALNTIDIAFNGGRERSRSTPEARIIRVWRDYHNELTNGLVESPSDQQLQEWTRRIDDHLTNLLEAIAADLGYTFDRDFLRTGGYYARGAAEHENEMAAIRRSLAKMVDGRGALQVINMTRDEHGNLQQVRLPI